MLVRFAKHPDLKLFQALHLFSEFGDLARQTIDLGAAPQRRLLPVGAVELVEIAINAVLDLRHAAFHLGPCEVPVAGVDRLELGASNRHAGIGQQPELAA